MSRAPYYPLFADLRGRRCVVIGAGPIAERKAFALLRCGARVTLVGPSVTRRLARAIRQQRLRHVARRFRAADVRGAWLAIAATDDPVVNASVVRAAGRRQILTNVVDQPAHCSFIAPAILRHGRLAIAISTGGASPSLAKRIRRDLAQRVRREYAPALRLLAALRPIVRQTLPSYGARKRYFDRLQT